MSEPDKPNQALDLANVADGEVRGSPGKVLRAARESAGIHIAALAGALKIPVSRLEALENDDFAAKKSTANSGATSNHYGQTG